jgi:hypothetical protein
MMLKLSTRAHTHRTPHTASSTAIAVPTRFRCGRFGFAHFGKVNGLPITLSGIMGQLQLPIVWVVVNKLGGHFEWMNLAGFVVRLPLLLVPWYYWKMGR